MIRFGLNAPEIDADWQGAGLLKTIGLIAKHKRMVFTKVTDLATIGMVEAQLQNRLYFEAYFQTRALVRHEGGREMIHHWQGLKFVDVLIEKINPRVYIEGTDTAVDTVWIVADEARVYIPTSAILMESGYH